MKHRPCESCPWRKDTPVGYWHRDHFGRIAEACRGDGMHVMACHKDDGRVCAGWAAVEGFNAIGLRIAAMRGNYDPAKLDVAGLTLYRSMADMIRANNKVYAAQGQKCVPLPRCPGA